MKRMLAATIVFLLGVAGILLFVPAVRGPVEKSLFGESNRPLTDLADGIKDMVENDNSPEIDNSNGNGER